MAQREQRPVGGSPMADHNSADESNGPDQLRVAMMRRRAQQRKAAQAGDGKSGQPEKAAEPGHELMTPSFADEKDPAKHADKNAAYGHPDGLMPMGESQAEVKDGAQIPLPGDKGILSGEATVKLGGKDEKLAAGTVVEVLGGADKLRSKSSRATRDRNRWFRYRCSRLSPVWRSATIRRPNATTSIKSTKASFGTTRDQSPRTLPRDISATVI